jgi:hypothetical protein
MVKSDAPSKTLDKVDYPMPSTFMPVITSDPANPADFPPEKIISTPFRKVVIDGVEFDFKPAPKTLQQIQVAIYSKAARAKMDFKEKTKLCERASAKTLQPKFTMMILKIDDPNKLTIHTTSLPPLTK